MERHSGLVIFANNTLLAGFAQIVLASMIVPFAGIALFGYRAHGRAPPARCLLDAG